VGDVLMAQNKPQDALTAYRKSLPLRERLAETDRGNSMWQRDLALNHGKLALTHLKLRNPNEALSELRKAREIMAAMVASEPKNKQWAKDLAVFDAEFSRLEGQTRK
jgi:hypothetical protein